MFIPKVHARARGRFHLVDPAELESIDEWGEWLEALFYGPCSIFERDGELLLLENKQLVERLNGLKIEIFMDEHAPPHFHVMAPGVNASFAIDDCRHLKGDISGSDAAKVRYWHKRARTKLIDVWNATRPTGCVVGPFRSGA